MNELGPNGTPHPSSAAPSAQGLENRLMERRIQGSRRQNPQESRTKNGMTGPRKSFFHNRKHGLGFIAAAFFLLLLSPPGAGAATVAVKKAEYDGVVILFLDKRNDARRQPLKADAFFAKIKRALGILSRQAPRIYRKIEALYGRAFIMFDPDYLKDRLDEVGLAKFRPRTGLEEYDSTPNKLYVTVMGRYVDKYSDREVAATITHELVGHGQQHRENRLYVMRDLDRECEARLLQMEAFQALKFDPMSEEMVAYRKILEQKYCRGFRKYTRGRLPILNKSWNRKNLPTGDLLAAFKDYLKSESR